MPAKFKGRTKMGLIYMLLQFLLSSSEERAAAPFHLQVVWRLRGRVVPLPNGAKPLAPALSFFEGLRLLTLDGALQACGVVEKVDISL